MGGIMFLVMATRHEMIILNELHIEKSFENHRFLDLRELSTKNHRAPSTEHRVVHSVPLGSTQYQKVFKNKNKVCSVLLGTTRYQKVFKNKNGVCSVPLGSKYFINITFK